MCFPKYGPNGLHGVGGKLAYVAQNCQLLEHNLLGVFHWFWLWLLPLINRSFEDCSGAHYPWDTATDKNLGNSSPVNAVPTQLHTSCWSVSPEIALSARLGSYLMCGGVRLAGNTVLLDVTLSIVPVMPKTLLAHPHNAPYSPFVVSHFRPGTNMGRWCYFLKLLPMLYTLWSASISVLQPPARTNHNKHYIYCLHVLRAESALHQRTKDGPRSQGWLR